MAAAEEELHEYFQANYPEVVVRVGEITFGEQQRKLKDTIKKIEKKLREQNNKDKSKKANKDTEKEIGQLKSKLEKKLKSQVTALTQAACALLNSGGGVIRAEIENKDYSYQKHGIGLDIEDAFRECIQSKTNSEYFDFIQQESSMSIFVKSWSSENSAYQRVCSVNTGLHERSSSSAVKIKPSNAMRFLKRKKDDAKVDSGWQGGSASANVQKCLLQPGVQTEKDINNAAAQFFEREQLDLGEILDFTESTTVEFKDFPRYEDSCEFARSILPRYASAFAHTKGGYLIFGVDNQRKVVGCKRNICPSRFEEVVGDTIDTLPVFHVCASKKKVVFSCKSLPVYGRSENGEEKKHGYVFVVRIEPSCCVVFETTPDSWIIEAGKMKRLTCTEWTLLMTEEDPDVSHFAEGFQIELCRTYKPPLSRSVYSNKSLTCMKTLQTNLFPVNPDGITCKPEELCEEVFSAYPSLKDLMMKKVEEISSSLGILIFSRSWAVDVGLQEHPSVASDVLLVAAGAFPTLYTVTVNKDHSVSSSTIPALEYSRNVACALKQKLVNEAGFSQKVCVIPHVIELGADGKIKTDLSWPDTHPLDYKVKKSKKDLEELLQALVIALLRFRSFLSDQLGCEFFNLLTVKQYGLLTKNLYKTKKLFVYGLPGSGKTVVALQIIEKIKNIFQCSSGEILYLCENRALCKTVRMRMRNMCQAVTRIDFINGDYSQPVKHIVIDEAQNFQSKDGDWYGKAVRLTEADPDKPGVLWIFLDYLQTSHTEASGLPDPAKQEPQEWLTTGVRNATQVYNGMMHVTEMIGNDSPERLQNVVDSICYNSILNILSPVQVFAVLMERVCNMLDSNITDNGFIDNLKYPQTHVCCGEAKAVWSFPDFFKNINTCREAMLHYPQRTKILYEKLKKLVDDGPQDAQETLDVAQVCIAMMEFMHEISCFPKRFQLFMEEFKRFVNKPLHADRTGEVDPWLELKEESKEEPKMSFQTLTIPYEQLNRLVEEARCGHSLQGIFDMCTFKDESETVTVVVQKCLEYFAKGYSAKNIAVLCSSIEERDRYKDFLERKMSNHMTDLRMNVCFTTAEATEGNAIVVDTVHHFSGLERSIVFAIFPAAKSSYLVPHLLVCMVSRANLHCHVLLDQSKGFCYITSAIENQAIQFLNQIVEPGTPGYHYGDCPENVVQKIMIPANKVELIIGKRGERIKELQIQAGVKMVTIPDDPEHTVADKPLLLMGDHYRVQQWKEMVLHLIHDQDHFIEKFNKYRSIIEELFFRSTFFIDYSIIKRMRKMFVKNNASVRILVKPADGMASDITADTIKLPDRGRYAAEIITNLFHTSEAGNPGGPGPGNRGRSQGNWKRRLPGRLKAFNYILPFDITKLITGKDGETLKRISQQSGARIELQSHLPPDEDPNVTVVTIQGKPLQCDDAQQLIEEKILALVNVLNCYIPHLLEYAVPGPHWPLSGAPYNRPCHIPVPGPPAQGWRDAYIYWHPQNPPEPSEPADHNSVPWTVSYTHYLVTLNPLHLLSRIRQRQRANQVLPRQPDYIKSSEVSYQDNKSAMADRLFTALEEILDAMLQEKKLGALADQLNYIAKQAKCYRILNTSYCL